MKKTRDSGISSFAAALVGGMIPAIPTMTGSDTARLNRQALEKIAEVFRVFSEPTRLQILQELKAGPLNVTQLVEALKISQANVSKQLRVLHDGGIIERKRLGTQAIYAIADPLTFELCRLVCEKLNREANTPQPTFAL